MQGLHLTADLAGCDPAAVALTNACALRAACRAAVDAAGLNAVAERFHAFPPPGGVTGVLLLAESHLAVHTWPEIGRVTIDVFVCNVQADNGLRAAAVLDAMVGLFAPQQVQRQTLQRGVAGPP
jgi:S-adenosylmethionine decarboxylase